MIAKALAAGSNNFVKSKCTLPIVTGHLHLGMCNLSKRGEFNGYILFSSPSQILFFWISYFR